MRKQSPETQNRTQSRGKIKNARNDPNRRHTPGPWIASGDGDSIWHGDIKIADLSAGPCQVPWYDERVANADLIAAAPRMLKVLKMVVRHMAGKQSVGHDAFLAAKKAIKEAEPDTMVYEARPKP